MQKKAHRIFQNGKAVLPDKQRIKPGKQKKNDKSHMTIEKRRY